MKPYKHILIKSTVLCIVLLLGIVLLAILYGGPYLYLRSKTAKIDSFGAIHIHESGKYERISPNNFYVFDLAWSPDHKNIAIRYSKQGRRLNSAHHLGILDTKTKQLRHLIKLGTSKETNHVVDYPWGDPWINTNFAWSPDGKKILFNMPSAEGNPQIYLLDVQTHILSPTELIFEETIDKRIVHIESIAWEPGPTPLITLCFYDKDDMERCDVSFVNADFKTITPLLSQAEYAHWLLDGINILYTCHGDNVKNSPRFFSKRRDCIYSTQTHSIKMLTEREVMEWSIDGLYAFDVQGGGEGDPTILTVYNSFLNITYQVPNWVRGEGRNLGYRPSIGWLERIQQIIYP